MTVGFLVALGVLLILLGVSLLLNAWQLREAALGRKEITRLRAKLEDGEVMPNRAEDPPAAIRRLRQDR